MKTIKDYIGGNKDKKLISVAFKEFDNEIAKMKIKMD